MYFSYCNDLKRSDLVKEIEDTFLFLKMKEKVFGSNLTHDFVDYDKQEKISIISDNTHDTLAENMRTPQKEIKPTYDKFCDVLITSSTLEDMNHELRETCKKLTECQ